MTDTATADTTTTVLELPDLDLPSPTQSSTVYRAGTVNQVGITLPNGEQVTSYVTFSGARLTALSGRVHNVKNSTRKVLDVSVKLVLEDLEVGLVDDQGERHPHPIMGEPRFAQWNLKDRPRRVNGQQWIMPDSVDQVKELCNFLHRRFRWNLARNPQNRAGSARTTRDLFSAWPDPTNEGNPRLRGAPVEAFGVRVNPAYDEGFSSFYEGLDDQIARWQTIDALTDPDAREVAMRNYLLNSHQVGGIVVAQNSNEQYFPRNVDIESLVIEETEFVLRPRGSEMDDSWFDEIRAEVDVTSAPVVSEDDLS